jgi:hypothetical protein
MRKMRNCCRLRLNCFAASRHHRCAFGDPQVGLPQTASHVWLALAQIMSESPEVAARTAFRSISQAFGMVFLDSPPILAANDALLFARIVDAVVLVVGTGNANLSGIRRAKEQLDAIGTPIIGAVLNRFEPKVHGPSNQPSAACARERDHSATLGRQSASPMLSRE